MIGKHHKGVLITLTERVAKKTLIAHAPSKHSALVCHAIIRLLENEPVVHTITFDNGKEFAEHQRIAQALGCDNYFARPYASWERGLNENHNGLIRQYLPKGTCLKKVHQSTIAMIERRLNNRPRKGLGYQTPNEAYATKLLTA